MTFISTHFVFKKNHPYGGKDNKLTLWCKYISIGRKNIACVSVIGNRVYIDKSFVKSFSMVVVEDKPKGVC